MPIFEPHTEDELLGKTKRPTGLTFLTPEQILMLDGMLAKIGDYGELHLIVDKGRLRFLIVQKSYDCNKWKPE